MKRYDLLHPSRCLIEENPRYLRMEHENHESYVAYLTINTIVGEMEFPSSELFITSNNNSLFPLILQ